MPQGEYAVAQAVELLAGPAGPGAEEQRRLLEEFLQNPFLDEDVLNLALRVGLSRAEVEECIAALCREGLLKEAGRRGFMLDLERVEATSEAVQAEGAESPSEPEPQGAVAVGGKLRGKAPLGIVLLRADGRPALVDEQAAVWLGMAPDAVDAAAFEALTGIDPGLMLGGAPRISFNLQDPQPLAVTMQACNLGSESGVLIVLQDASPQAELAAVHAHVQEELFVRLQRDVVEPMLCIQQFLENPDAGELGQARTALEQVNSFLEEFLLSGRKGDAAEGDSPEHS